MHREAYLEYKRRYYKVHRVKLCRQFLQDYIPENIKRYAALVPEKVQELYRQYPFETFGDPMIRHLLLRYRVFPHMAAYQDCYDAASDAYMFGIHRCAFCGYTGVGEYIRKLIPIAAKCALAVADEGRIICQENDLKRIYLDDPEKKKK